VLDGYFDIDGNRFYISGDTVVVQNTAEYNEENNSYTYTFRPLDDEELRIFNIEKMVVSEDKTYITLYYVFETHNCSVVSGYTDSKLDLLRRKEITTDDLGNELPGYFRSIVDIPMKKVDGSEVVDVEAASKMSKYNVPYDECLLDILYKVGEVSDLKPIGVSKTRFIGNITTNIKFYYADEFRNPIIVHEANNDDALDAIKQCEDDLEASDNENIVEVLLCDITYHIGANIVKNDDNTYTMDESGHTGVKYIDTVYVTKQVGTYYLNYGKQFTFNYYLLSQDVDTITLTDFNTDVIWDASTYFEMDALLYHDDGWHIDYDRLWFSGFSENNNIIAAPLFRTEFNLASSLPQNVEADIYIDRGINAAFEKHLKLQEFRTMEALENYGNGWFKINKY